MIPIPFIIQGLSALAPSVLGLLKKKSTASSAIEMISATAQAITGESSDDKALEVLKNDPAKLAEYQQSVNKNTLDMYEAETARMDVLNQTIIADNANKDGYVRRMRPTFGYALVFCFVSVFITVTATALIVSVKDAVDLIGAYAKMQWIFVAAFSAIGVYITGRTKEKTSLAGNLGGLGGLARKLFRR